MTPVKSCMLLMTALVGLMLFSIAQASQLAAPQGYVSSDPSGTVTCDASGKCGQIYLTPSTDSYSYLYQATCLTTQAPSTLNTTDFFNCDWGAFNPSFDACDLGQGTWGSACPLTVLETGLSPGTYSINLLIDYLACPPGDMVGGQCSTYQDNFVQFVQPVQATVSSTSSTPPSSTPTPTPTPAVPGPSIWGLFALALLSSVFLKLENLKLREAFEVFYGRLG